MKGKVFDGLCQSYKQNPRNPNSRYIAQYGRVWVYDAALAVYADLKSGEIEKAKRAVNALVALAKNEESNGFRGLWHFSYNTMDDDFIDPRGPLGANLWALNSIYAYILATGDTQHLDWANAKVAGFVFSQQVTAQDDKRCGLFRAGLENPADLARGDSMGYHVYEGLPSDFDRILQENQQLSQQILGYVLPHPLNKPVALLLDLKRRLKPVDEIINSQVQFCSIEHNADAMATLRLAARATQHFRPHNRDFLAELGRRHKMAMESLARLWVTDEDGTGHFVTGMNADGSLNTSVAVDNNTWVPAVLLDYDDLVWKCIQYTEERFLIEDCGFKGLFFFTKDFKDGFVDLTPEERAAMERMIQPEATFGFIHLLREFAHKTNNAQRRDKALQLADELYCNMVGFQSFYARHGDPYEHGVAGFRDAAAGLIGAAARGFANEPRVFLGKVLEEGKVAADKFRRWGTPYASCNIPNYFNTLESVAATATGVVVTQVLLGANGDDFITVAPPKQWLTGPLKPTLAIPGEK